MGDGETPEQAVLREAIEETGLRELQLVRFLGGHLHDSRPFGKDEIHHRFFFHLRCTIEPPATWRHYETDPSDGPGELPLFEFFWARLPDQVPELIAEHGYFVPWLLRSEADAVVETSQRMPTM